MRFQRIQNTLARRGVGDELPACQRGAKRAALRRMLALRAKKEGVLAPDVDAAFSAEGLVNFGDLGRRGDGVADDTAANMVHDVGDCAVAVDNVGDAGVFGLTGFHSAVCVRVVSMDFKSRAR